MFWELNLLASSEGVFQPEQFGMGLDWSAMESTAHVCDNKTPRYRRLNALFATREVEMCTRYSPTHHRLSTRHHRTLGYRLFPSR
jgi:hypothetical protein